MKIDNSIQQGKIALLEIMSMYGATSEQYQIQAALLNRLYDEKHQEQQRINKTSHNDRENHFAQQYFIRTLQFLAGNVSEVVSTISHEAEVEGLAESQCFMGYAYYYGKGVAQDYKKAVHYLQLSAKQGNLHAQLLLNEHNNDKAFTLQETGDVCGTSDVQEDSTMQQSTEESSVVTVNFVENPFQWMMQKSAEILYLYFIFFSCLIFAVLKLLEACKFRWSSFIERKIGWTLVFYFAFVCLMKLVHSMVTCWSNREEEGGQKEETTTSRSSTEVAPSEQKDDDGKPVKKSNKGIGDLLIIILGILIYNFFVVAYIQSLIEDYDPLFWPPFGAIPAICMEVVWSLDANIMVWNANS